MSTIDQIPPEYREVLIDVLVRAGERVVREILNILRKPPGDVTDLVGNALASMRQSQYHEAIDLLSKALQHRLGYESRGAVMLLIAQCHENVGEWAKAEHHAREAAKQAVRADARALHATALNVEGVAHAQRAELALAESLFSEALNEASHIAAPDLEAIALANLAAVRLERHDPGAAEQLLRTAYGLSVGDPLTAGICLVNWSVVDRRRAQSTAACNKLCKALYLFRQIGYRLGEADALAGLAILSAEVGDFVGAEGYFRRSLELSAAIGSLPRQVIACRGLARMEFISGRMEKSRELYRRALKLSRRIGDRRGVAKINGELGIVAERLGNPKQAIKCFNEALTVFSEIDDPLGKAVTLANLGSAYAELGEPETAETFLNEGLAIHAFLGNKPGEVATLVSIGRVALMRADKAAVGEIIQRARRLLAECVAFDPDLELLAHSVDRLESDAS